MKRRPRHRTLPPPPMPVAVFHCRQCHAALTPPLGLLTDAASLSQAEGESRVPAGQYWPVTAGQDFAGHLAVPPAAVVGLGYHPDRQRLMGCCGPSGAHGPNRVCGCGAEVGTEQSDCLWPQAVYLDPARVRATAPAVEPGPDAASSELSGDAGFCGDTSPNLSFGPQ